MITPEQVKLLTEQPDVAKNMELFGGSFISNLGRALCHADYINCKKIHDMYPTEWEFYLNIKRSPKLSDRDGAVFKD